MRLLLPCWFWLLMPFVVSADPPDPSLKTPDSFPRFAPVEPPDVAKTFVVQGGLEMQLIAAEPLVTDPVAMAIDEDGCALVVEMNDYPYTDAKTHKAWQDNTTDAPLGRVRWLEDSDNDGRYDRNTIFAEGLSWPSGIACYRGGVFVTATPDVWYLKDTDGDHKADVRQKVFTGFRKYNVQAVMNNPVWGLDNKLYVAGSSNGGSVIAPGQTQNKPVTARGDFRFDPRTQALELQAGGARFGNAFDDWGNRFLCNIRNPAIHVVLDNTYLARNPFFAAPSAIFNIAEAGDQMPIYRLSPVEPWRDLRGRQWSADPTKKLPRSELTGGGVFTSTSGINVYRGDVYPAQYHGQLFVAEVANNVIYRQTKTDDGNTFRAERADKNVEFVASTDTWFRPVNLINAPDGTLYVLDMYREFIEHPWSIPDDIHARLDLRSGSDRGRIYRLAPVGFKPPAFKKLSEVTSDDLVDLLAAPDAWHRETAQRLLVERGDERVVGKLSKLLGSEHPRAVLHALWTLRAFDKLTVEQIQLTLQHASPHIREHAIRLAEAEMPRDEKLLQAVVDGSGDDNLRVRLQCALSLGNIENERTLTALSDLAVRDGADSWIRAAICSAKPTLIPKILMRVVNTESVQVQSVATIVDSLMQTSAAMNDPGSIAELLEAAHRQESDAHGERMEDMLWRGLFHFARRKSVSLHDFFDETSCGKLTTLFPLEKTLVTALNTKVSLDQRQSAVAQLTLHPLDVTVDRFSLVVDQSLDSSLAVLAIQALGTYKGPEVGGALLPRLKNLTPMVRDEALAVLLARPERTLALLDAIEGQRVPPGLLGLPRKTQLLASAHAQVKSRAETVLGQVDAARGPVVKRFLSDTPANGKAEQGRELFRKHCANCHRADGMGFEIGPHMETVRNWDKEKLLTNILDPSRELAPQSMAYAIALSSGTVISGMIAEETASSLVIKRAGVLGETLLRDDIEAISNTGLSLMPAGFEESISPEQMADLLAFLTLR